MCVCVCVCVCVGWPQYEHFVLSPSPRRSRTFNHFAAEKSSWRRAQQQQRHRMRPTAGGYPLARWCSCCACCLRNSELVCVSTTVAPAYKCRGAHDLAIKAMGDLGLRMRAHSGMEAVEDTLCRPKRTVQFRRYAWAGGGRCLTRSRGLRDADGMRGAWCTRTTRLACPP